MSPKSDIKSEHSVVASEAMQGANGPTDKTTPDDISGGFKGVNAEKISTAHIEHSPTPASAVEEKQKDPPSMEE